MYVHKYYNLYIHKICVHKFIPLFRPYTLLDPTTGRNIEQEQNDVIPDLSPPKYEI